MDILEILNRIEYLEINRELLIAGGDLFGEENELQQKWERLLQNNNIYR